MHQQQIETDILVMAAQEGSGEAFTLLFRRFNPAVLRYAIKFSGSESIAQEAVQEAWIEVARGIRKLKDARAFRSWLFKKVRWRVVDEARKAKRFQADEMAESETMVTDNSADQTGQTLGEIMKCLPLLEREMIQLFYLDEMTVAEISIVLEIPVGTVKSRLNRARNLLKERVKEDE